MKLLATTIIIALATLGCDSDAEKSMLPTQAAGDAEIFVPTLEEFPVPAGSRPHDVAPGAGGIVWYTAQRQAALGRLDPTTGETRHIALGTGAAPQGVIVGLPMIWPGLLTVV